VNLSVGTSDRESGKDLETHVAYNRSQAFKGFSMARQLKRWESPRREGRNDKGRGGSARQRQRKKQFQTLRQKLKEQSKHQRNSQQNQKGDAEMLPLFNADLMGLSLSQVWTVRLNIGTNRLSCYRIRRRCIPA